MQSLEYQKRFYAFRMLQQFRPWLAACAHDLGGFPRRSSDDTGKMAYGFMPSHIPLAEIMATDCYSVMLDKVFVASQAKKFPPYGRLFDQIMYSRLDIPCWNGPKSVSTLDELKRGFASLCLNNELSRHGLPVAFIWANSELANNERKPFIIQGEMIDIGINIVQNGNTEEIESYLVRAIQKCREDEAATS